MKNVKVGFFSLVTVCLFISCERDELGVNDDGVVILQNQKPIKDTLSIVERQEDSLFFWDPGNIEIQLPHRANIVVDSTNIELKKSVGNRASLLFKGEWPRTQRDSISHFSLTIISAKGDSSVKNLVIQWKGIPIPDSLWQKITLEPAEIGKISMYPGEKRSIQFVWNYPKQLRGLLKAEVADQAVTETHPNWRPVPTIEKRKYTSSFVYGKNLTARFRIKWKQGHKEVSFAVVSIVF